MGYITFYDFFQTLHTRSWDVRFFVENLISWILKKNVGGSMKASPPYLTQKYSLLARKLFYILYQLQSTLYHHSLEFVSHERREVHVLKTDTCDHHCPLGSHQFPLLVHVRRDVGKFAPKTKNLCSSSIHT